MGISGIASTNSMSVMQMTTTSSKDQKSKSIQNEITDAQQQIQKLSSKEELSVDEKANERKKLQKEITDLNTELKQHQEELRRSQKREIMMAKLREDQEPAKEETSEDKIQTENTSSGRTDEKRLPADGQQTGNQGTVISRNSDGAVILKGAPNQDKNPGVDTETRQAVDTGEEDTDERETESTDTAVVTDTGIPQNDMRTMVSTDLSAKQANRLGTVIAKTSDGIAILKGEINQDEKRGVDTERKQAELDKMEKKEERATTFQFSILGDTDNAGKSAANTDAANASAQVPVEKNAFANALNGSLEEQAAQQRFYVSIA